MIGSLLSLIVLAGIIFLSVLIFRPENGWFWALKKRFNLSDRVLREDTLKYFADCEIEGNSAGLRDLAGTLGISEGDAGRILSQLLKQELLKMEGGHLKLSKEGLDYGLRMIRAHRLYETYMAEYSGYSQTEWHEKADYAEHSLTADEIEALARELNFPVLDPHGDPIPNADGKIKEYTSKITLNEMQAGESGCIVHLEDEPKEIYSQLIAEGLYPGQMIRILEDDGKKIRFWGGSEEHILSSILAANVQLVRKTEKKNNEENNIPTGETLADCRLGGSSRILQLSPRISGTERRRLMDLGFLPGTLVEKELVSSAGDPMGFRIRGTLIAIRRSQAEQIFAREEKNSKEDIA